MKERLIKYAPWIGYPIFYLFCFVVFGIFTFPFERLKDRIVATFNAQQKPGPGQQELRIDDMSSSWLTGVKMTNVRLLSAPTEPGKPPSELKIDEARVRLSILPLLIGHKSLSFKLDAFGGNVDGTFVDSGKDREIEAELEDLDVNEVGPLADAIGLPLEGRLGGNFDLKLPEGKASKGSGNINLDAKDLAIGDGKAKLNLGQGMGLPLPKLNIGDLTFVSEARDGVMKVSKLDASGKDIDLHGDGRVELREIAPDSLCNINLRFKVNDSYKNKNDTTKSLFGPGGIVEFDPKVKSSKRPDGFYGWTMTGKLGQPKFVPSGGATTPGLGK